ncbi:hypothetical protein [Kitasatospora paranensis]|uniref:Uncharacterized protein n=1 Tax=Kitasatospora paranensis TaxID=258053 RepID=A0ABW2G094_9ACTN
MGSAVLQALPGNSTVGALTAGTDDFNGWIGHLDHTVALNLGHAETAVNVAVAALQAAIGLAALRPGRLRTAAAWTGAGLSLIYWVAGQGLGQLSTGQATDPNTAPLIVLFACALASTTPAAALSDADRPSVPGRTAPS